MRRHLPVAKRPIPSVSCTSSDTFYWYETHTHLASRKDFSPPCSWRWPLALCLWQGNSTSERHLANAIRSTAVVQEIKYATIEEWRGWKRTSRNWLRWWEAQGYERVIHARVVDLLVKNSSKNRQTVVFLAGPSLCLFKSGDNVLGEQFLLGCPETNLGFGPQTLKQHISVQSQLY